MKNSYKKLYKNKYKKLWGLWDAKTQSTYARGIYKIKNFEFWRPTTPTLSNFTITLVQWGCVGIQWGGVLGVLGYSGIMLG